MYSCFFDVTARREELRRLRGEYPLEAARCYSLVNENQRTTVALRHRWQNLPFDLMVVMLSEIHDVPCLVQYCIVLGMHFA